MNVIEFKKYKRAFLFGCSFTHYYWPTWADLVALEIPETYIYAKTGAGNLYIYQAFIEAKIRHNIKKDDLVLIMFSNVTREDRYTVKDGWITPGNLFSQGTYDKDFLDKFFCEKGYLMRDLSLVEGIDSILSNIGLDYSLMSIVNLDSLKSDQVKMTNVDSVIDFYQKTIKKLKPSVFESVFNNNWSNKKLRPKYMTHWCKDLYVDNHPTPVEHLEYLLNVFPNTKFHSNTLSLADQWTKKLLNLKTFNEIESCFLNIIKPTAERL